MSRLVQSLQQEKLPSQVDYTVSYAVQRDIPLEKSNVNVYSASSSPTLVSGGISTRQETLPSFLCNNNHDFSFSPLTIVNNDCDVSNKAYPFPLVPTYTPALECVPQQKHGYCSTEPFFPYIAPPLAPLTFESTSYNSLSDMPCLNSITGCIILCIYCMTVLSLFICLGRPDYNFIIYLIGYYIWSIDAKINTHEACSKAARYVQQYSLLLCAVCIFDVIYLFMSFPSWTCNNEIANQNEQAESCFSKKVNLKLKLTYSLHSFVLYLSLINIFIKILVISLNFAWMKQKKKGLLIEGLPKIRCHAPCATFISQQ